MGPWESFKGTFQKGMRTHNYTPFPSRFFRFEPHAISNRVVLIVRFLIVGARGSELVVTLRKRKSTRMEFVLVSCRASAWL